MIPLSRTVVLALIDERISQIPLTATPTEVHVAIGKLLCDLRTYLPCPYNDKIISPPSCTAPITNPLVEDVALANIVGDNWIFQSQDTWPSCEGHWQRVANLLFASGSRQLAKADQIVQAVRPNAVIGMRLKNGNVWIDEGLRRIYAIWLLGGLTVPVLIVDKEASTDD